jgi:hypothetical protein
LLTLPLYDAEIKKGIGRPWIVRSFLLIGVSFTG